MRTPLYSRDRQAQKARVLLRGWLLLWLYLLFAIALPGLHVATHKNDHDHHAGGLHYHAPTNDAASGGSDSSHPAEDASGHSHSDSHSHSHSDPHSHSHADRDLDDSVGQHAIHAHSINPDASRASGLADPSHSHQERASLRASVASHNLPDDHAAGSLCHFAQSVLQARLVIELAHAALLAYRAKSLCVHRTFRACQVAGSLGARAPPDPLSA